MLCKKPVDQKFGEIRQKRSFTIFSITDRNQIIFFNYVWKLQAYRLFFGWVTVGISIQAQDPDKIFSYESSKTHRRQLE